jgi:cytidyltransferase-like protein
MAKVIPGSKGLIIGKFMPLHMGHVHLIDFAQSYVEKLTVVVCSIKSEPIHGKIRYEWVKEMFPNVKVIHLTDENPQEPKDHPRFWKNNSKRNKISLRVGKLWSTAGQSNENGIYSGE